MNRIYEKYNNAREVKTIWHLGLHNKIKRILRRTTKHSRAIPYVYIYIYIYRTKLRSRPFLMIFLSSLARVKQRKDCYILVQEREVSRWLEQREVSRILFNEIFWKFPPSRKDQNC